MRQRRRPRLLPDTDSLYNERNPGSLRRRYRTRQRGRCQAHKRSAEELPVSVEFPGEQGVPGVATGRAPIAQRITHDKRPSLRSHLRVGPRPPVTIAGVKSDLGKQAFQALELKTLLHALLVELLQVFGIDELGVAVDQKQTIVARFVQRIHHPTDVDLPGVSYTGQDCELAMVLLVKLAGEAHRARRRAGLGHLRHEAVGVLASIRRITAHLVRRGDQVLWRLPDIDWDDGFVLRKTMAGEDKCNDE